MNNYKFFLVFIILIFFFLEACNTNSSKISEGEIIYSIEYLQDENEMPILALLPKEMSTKFKNNNTVSLIRGFWGTFEMRFITNYQQGKVFTILKIFSKKYLFKADTGEIEPGYEEMLDIKIKETGKDTTFYTESKMPIKCYEAEVNSPVFGNKPIKVYYTYDIAIKNPNIGTPYKKIPGILVAFQVRLVGIDMKFKIKEINLTKIEDSEFSPQPDEYKEISKEEFSKLLKSFTQ